MTTADRPSQRRAKSHWLLGLVTCAVLLLLGGLALWVARDLDNLRARGAQAHEQSELHVEVGGMTLQLAPPWRKLNPRKLSAIKREVNQTVAAYARQQELPRSAYPRDITAFQHDVGWAKFVAYTHKIDKPADYLANQQKAATKRLAWGKQKHHVRPLRNEQIEIAGQPCLLVELERMSVLSRTYTLLSTKDPKTVLVFLFTMERESAETLRDLETALATLQEEVSGSTGVVRTPVPPERDR